MKEKTIRVCDNCGVPLIWTFAFDYCERFCINCGSKGGMLGTGKDIRATRELIFQKKLVDKIWSVIYSKKGLCPVSCQKDNCKKCDKTSEKHYRHLSKAQKEWDFLARKYLEKFQGIFN